MALLNELRTNWSGVAGSPYYTTIRHRDDASVNLTAFQTAWGIFVNSLKTNFSSAVVASNDPEVRVIESTTNETVAVKTVSVGTWAGTGGGDALPPATQLLIQLQTNNFVGGRRIKGRIFVPCQLETNSTVTGQPSAGYRGAVDALLATMLTSMGDSFVIYSPTHKVYATVQGAHCWDQWAVLRSRRD